MNKLKRVSLACFFLFVSFWGNAQTVVTGKVTSNEGGIPLPGVSITIKGTTKGTSTDDKGMFKLSVPANSTLQASFIGFADANQVVGNRSVVDFILNSDVKSLNEVVVTGYGSQIKRDLTGNIVKIKSSEIQDMPVTTFEQSIQGKAAGVQINQGSGKLAQGIQVRVRGQSSVSASNEPLYVLDGIPLTQGDLGNNGGKTNPLVDINPQDIESIEILKDASAGAIYGARAANGVVLITTKRGKSGATKITFGMQYGKSKATKVLKFLNTQQYIDFYRTAAANSDAIDGIDAKDPDSYTAYMESFFDTQSLGTLGKANQADTDWGSLAFQNAPSKQYDLNLSGGSEKTTFFISGQLLDQTGILLGNAFNRYTGRMNLNHKVSERLNVGMNMSVARSLNERVSGDRQFDNPLQLVALPPMTPQNDPTTGLPVGSPPGDISIPVYYNGIINLGNAYYNTNNYFVYDNVLGKHSVNATAGLSYQNSQTKTSSAEGKDFPSDAYRMIASAARKTDASSTQSDYRFASYFTRLNYKFNDKYLLGLSARIDGSSRFGADNRYGFFPAVSAGWILSEENFLKNIELISFLKLRASWGKTGNAEIGNFPQLGLFTGDAGYGALPGQRPVQLSNPNLGWESTQQIDIGLDFGILKNRINGEIDYYEKNTTGLLLNVNVPGTTGFATQTKNVGSLTNKGFEFVLNTDNLVGQFKWKTSLNASTNNNKITDLQGQVIEGGLANMSRAVEGQPLGTFFTVEYAGVDPTNGDALFYKNTKNTDGSIDRSTTKTYSQAQRTVIGSPLPKWVAGVTNTFSYKGFELSVFFNGVFGNKLNFYGVGRFSSANGRYEDNQTVNQLAAWTPKNTNTIVPQARLFFNNGAQASSRFIEDGSYVRLRNVTFAYNLPKALISKVKLSNVRLYVTGQNLLTFTKYSGWDPEVNADDVVTNIALGYDFYTTPQAKTFMGGLNISF